MNAIVCVDNNWGIGKDNELLFRIKDDLKHFKDITFHKVVLMGRNTFESLPNKKPLKNRINFIFTRDLNYQVEGAKVVHSYEEFMKKFSYRYQSFNTFVIGGSEIYELFLPHIDQIYLTRVNTVVDGANKFFPNLDKISEWKIDNRSDIFIDKKSGLEYEYILYKKSK